MNAASDFPVDWRQVTLRELHSGGVDSLDPRNFPNERFEYYSIPAYQEGTRPLVVQGSEIQSQKLLIPDSCLLFGKLNPRVEKVWNVKSTATLRRLASTEWLPIVPVEELDQDFGYYLLRSEWVMPIAKGLVSGSTPSRERVEPKAFYDIEVPLPSLAEQKRIATVLSLLDRSVHKQSELLAELTDLKRAAMRELFTRGLRGEPQKETEIGPVPESWQIKAIGHVFEIVQGLSLKGNLSGGSDGVPFLRTSNVYWGRIDLKNVSHMHVAPELIGDRWLRLGDLLVCEGGEIGRAAVWESKEPGYTYQNHLHRLRPLIGGSIEPKFAAAWLEVGFCHRKVYEGAGNKTTIPNLSRARLAELPMPVPAIDEQREIVTILDAIDRKIELHRKKRAVLEDLFKALLHKLMTGEIRVDALDLSALQAHAGPVSPAAELAV